jgi:N-succinyldiaminopimelate aminotransferase
MPRYPSLSSRVTGLSAQVYTSLLKVAQCSGNEVFALNVGDTFCPPPAAASAPPDAPRGPLGYTDVRGLPALLDAIAERASAEGLPLSREHLIVTQGATSGLDITVRALLSPGDEVVILAPFWPLIRGIVSAASGVPVEVPFFDRLADPAFDPRRAIEAAITPQTVAIYVNSPNNPTGAVLEAAHLDVLADVAQDHDLWVISDTAYARLSHVPVEHLARHPRLAPRTITAHTFSKTYGLAGARIGYLHCPSPAFAGLLDLQCYATYCAARPSQELVVRVLRDPESERWLERTRDAYREAGQRTAQVLDMPPPSSGTFVLFDTRRFRQAHESCAEFLARAARAGLVLTPGSATGSAYAEYARLCFTSVPRDALTRALAVLTRVMEG